MLLCGWYTNTYIAQKRGPEPHGYTEWLLDYKPRNRSLKTNPPPIQETVQSSLNINSHTQLESRPTSSLVAIQTHATTAHNNIDPALLTNNPSFFEQTTASPDPSHLPPILESSIPKINTRHTSPTVIRDNGSNDGTDLYNEDENIAEASKENSETDQVGRHYILIRHYIY
jgi:hypothetical protein